MMGEMAGHKAAAGQGGHGNRGSSMCCMQETLPGVTFESDILRMIK